MGASERVAQTVVTGETIQAFALQKLGLNTEDSPLDTKVGAQETAEKPAAKAEDHDDGDEEKKNGFQKRIDRANAARDEARRAAAEAQSKAQRLEAELAAAKGVKAPAPEPKPEQFTDAVQYGKAYGAWEAQKILAEKAEADAKQRAKEAADAIIAAWRERLDKARKEMPDFKEVVDESDVLLPDPLRDAMIESEMGPQLAYFWAQNPDEIAKLAKLSGKALERAIGRLEARLETQAEEQKKSSKKADSEAPKPKKAPPEPISMVTGGKSGAGEGMFDANGEFTGTAAQWKALRQAGKV